MSKKKGTSFDEKRRILLDAFHESSDVINAKEAEKLAERKGIRGPVAKEVLKALVDDSLVDTEKVGGSNYFWANRSKEANLKKMQSESLEEKENQDKQRLEDLKVKLKEILQSEPDSKKRLEAENRLESLQSRREKLVIQHEKYKDCDPEVFDKQKEDVEVSKDAVERWTDGVFGLKKFAKDQFNMEDEEVNQNFGIQKDFDYLE